MADGKYESIGGQRLTTEMESYYWFYHLGGDVYRIIKLSSGLSLEDKSGVLVQNWTDTSDAQKWKVSRQSNGGWRFVNVESGRTLCENDRDIVTSAGRRKLPQTSCVFKSGVLP